MEADELYARGRMLAVDEDEIRVWRHLGLPEARIIDLLKDEFWLTRQTAEDAEPEDDGLDVITRRPGASGGTEYSD